MVYVSKVCEASYLEDLQSDYFESIWLKLHHPDQVVTEPTSEDAATCRPLTIGTPFQPDIRNNTPKLICTTLHYTCYDIDLPDIDLHDIDLPGQR